jgi:hypothetical protein
MISRQTKRSRKQDALVSLGRPTDLSAVAAAAISETLNQLPCTGHLGAAS